MISLAPLTMYKTARNNTLQLHIQEIKVINRPSIPSSGSAEEYEMVFLVAKFEFPTVFPDCLPKSWFIPGHVNVYNQESKT